MHRLLVVITALLFFSISPSVAVLADTAAPSQTLSVEEAVELALANRSDVQVAALNLGAAQISDELAWDSVNDIISNSPAGASSSAWDQTYVSDYTLQSAQKNYETKLENVEYTVYQNYYAVVTALDSADSQRLISHQAQDKLKIAELRAQLGMDTKLSVYQAHQAAVSAQANHAIAQLSLDQKYTDLMEYIGKPSGERPTLVRELSYSPLQISDPESMFREIVKNSPSVWLAEKSLDLQELNRINSPGLEGELSDIQTEKAEITVITTEEAMLQATRSIYYNVLNIEESYNTAIQSAKAADEALRVAKLLYEVGMGTKTDVTAAEIAAQSAHQAVNSLSYQHAMLVMAFERPWIAGSSL